MTILAKMHLLRYLLITGQLYHWSRCTVSQTSIQGLNHKPFQWISEWWFKVTSLCSIIWHSIDLSFGWAIYYITSKYTAVIVVLVIIRVSNLSRWPCFGMAGNLIKMLSFFFFFFFFFLPACLIILFSLWIQTGLKTQNFVPTWPNASIFGLSIMACTIGLDVVGGYHSWYLQLLKTATSPGHKNLINGLGVTQAPPLKAPILKFLFHRSLTGCGGVRCLPYQRSCLELGWDYIICFLHNFHKIPRLM